MNNEKEIIQQQNIDKLAGVISRLDCVGYETVAGLLPDMLKIRSLDIDHSVYTPADASILCSSGIGRYLLFDNPDPAQPLSIWVFAIGTKQKTSIHDHKYKGTVVILEGPMTEKYYEPTGPQTAKRIDSLARYRFHTNKDELQDGFVHQLKRCKASGGGVSVSLHIYNMPAQHINDNGDSIDNRNLNIIYQKDSSPSLSF